MDQLILRTVLPGMMTTIIVRCAEIIIKAAPPAPVSVAVIGRAPTAWHVWIPGYYMGVSGRYVWVPGKWMVPPRAGVDWVPPFWRQGPRGYLFVPGHWR